MIVVGATVAVVTVALSVREYARTAPDAPALTARTHVTAPELWAAFQHDAIAATARFVGDADDQAVHVSGVIRAIAPSAGDGPVHVLLDTGVDTAVVRCEFARGTVPLTWAPGMHVAVMGRCTGMRTDVTLVRCMAAHRSPR